MRSVRERIQRKSGTTLVEMMVSLLLLELLMVLVMGVMSPAAKMFVRTQRLEFAQMILDNVAEEMKGQLQNAVSFAKIYEAEDLRTAGEQGPVLEFMNTEGYVVLLSAGGCADTEIIRGDRQAGQSGEIEAGKLLMRYYRPKVEREPYEYDYKKDGKFVARAVNEVFTKEYYMKNYLTVEFRYPEGHAEEADGNVHSLLAEVKLYTDESKTQLLAQDTVVLNIRYQTKRVSTATAQMG